MSSAPESRQQEALVVQQSGSGVVGQAIKIFAPQGPTGDSSMMSGKAYSTDHTDAKNEEGGRDKLNHEHHGGHGDVVAPCRARGMPKDHNFKNAYFVIPENADHGDELRCSYKKCRESGTKFRYCLHCKAPVAKRNFRNRHRHGLPGGEAGSDSTNGEDDHCSEEDVAMRSKEAASSHAMASKIESLKPDSSLEQDTMVLDMDRTKRKSSEEDEHTDGEKKKTKVESRGVLSMDGKLIALERGTIQSCVEKMITATTPHGEEDSLGRKYEVPANKSHATMGREELLKILENALTMTSSDLLSNDVLPPDRNRRKQNGRKTLDKSIQELMLDNKRRAAELQLFLNAARKREA